MRGGDNYMVKKIGLATGTFALAAIMAGTVAFAQTATPTATVSPIPTTSTTTLTPTPSASIPSGAPATGR